jgi:hypothetical protein
MKTNGCNNGENIYFLKYINMFRASLCPSSGYKYGKAALRLHVESSGCAACGREEL